MVLFFAKRDGNFRNYANGRKDLGLFVRRLDFGRDAAAGRRWGVQVGHGGPIPAGATVAK